MTPRRLPALVLLTILAVGCGPSVLLPAEDGRGTSGGSTGEGSGAVTVPPPPPATSTTSTTSTSTTPMTTILTVGQDTGDESSSDTGAMFIEDPEDDCFNVDGYHSLCIECDIFGEDCPEGEKCMPWANDSGPYWNATRCTPIDDDPGAPGEPCTVEGNAVTGIDSCEPAAMCWGVDPQTNEGTCIAMCTGDEANPQCAPSTSCLIAGDGALVVCLPTCDPLADDCGASEQCEPTTDTFTTDTFGCYPSTESSPVGGPCDFLGICDVGLTCVDADVVAPSCDPASPGCCTPWCDLLAADPSAGCFDPAQQCVPWWGEEPAPAGLEHVGVCAVTDL